MSSVPDRAPRTNPVSRILGRLFPHLSPEKATSRLAPHLLVPPRCFGRDELCQGVIRSALESGSVLLLGGRQSGKTTVLNKIAHDLRRANLSLVADSNVIVPILMDLMRLPYDAKPDSFYGALLDEAVLACGTQVPEFERHFRQHSRKRSGVDIDMIQEVLTDAACAVPKFRVRFIFLLDEAKRILGSRFPRGVQDNLFSLMYGNPFSDGLCSIVFAGAQELYHFCEDDTSPIGSRTAKHLIVNLAPTAVEEMIAAVGKPLDKGEIQRRAAMIHALTGGHAGLSSPLAQAFARSTIGSEGEFELLANRLRQERSELFQVWVNGLSPEARVIHDKLLMAGDMLVSDALQLLENNNLKRHRIDRACEELQFTGIARRDQNKLIGTNKLYSETAVSFISPIPGCDREQLVWKSIETLETKLRRFIRVQYDKKFGAAADSQIKRALGDVAWTNVQENKRKAIASYRSASTPGSNEILDYTYLGQLAQLVVYRAAWDLFRAGFRDKREFEDMIGDIVPVRNDQAHFRTVQEIELDRCRIRCEDLLVILEKLGT